MTLHPQKFREMVLQILYSKDMGDASEEGLIPILSKELAVSKKSIRAAIERAQAITQQLPALDACIRNTCSSYNFERIRSVERNVLRLGTFEILYDPSIPPPVAIAEAIRLAQKFATPEAAAFVNAVLDSIYKSSQGQGTDLDALAMELQKIPLEEVPPPVDGVLESSASGQEEE